MFQRWRNSVVELIDIKCTISLFAVLCFLFHFSLPSLAKSKIISDSADSSFQELETVNSIDFEEAESQYSVGYLNQGFPLKISIAWLALILLLNLQEFIRAISYLLSDIPPPVL